MTTKLSQYLKTIDSFTGRLAERRRLGQNSEAIARYAHQMVVNKRTNTYLRLDVDEASLPNLLTAEEHAAYRRLVAAEWARTQRKALTSRAGIKHAEKIWAEAEIRCAAEKERHKKQTEIRRSLLAKGAVTIREVARRLDISVANVRTLYETGQLPSDGFTPIQYSRGKPVHLWLPKTIICYLNGLR